MKRQASLCAALILALQGAWGAERFDADRWLSRFSFEPPARARVGVCAGVIGDLPSFQASTVHTGKQLVRVSLPVAPGAMPEGLRLGVRSGNEEIEADLRILTLHPGDPPSVRRGILNFPYDFKDTEPHLFALSLRPSRGEDLSPGAPPSSGRFQVGSSW